ncbi:MAG: RNA polymerase sigma factor [Opitutales bacterium]|nr:RNA polymerase sigma factor [Opitutales bacterium]
MITAYAIDNFIPWQFFGSNALAPKCMDKEAKKPETIDESALLMARIAKGDEDALAQLIDHWKGPLINFFYRSVRSRELSEDMAQEVFIRLYKAAPRYRPEAKFSTYLFAIARRRLINEHRRNTRKPLETFDPKDLGHVHGQESDNIALFEIEEAFDSVLDTLPENHRNAILLLKQKQLSYQEIAEELDTTESSVKTWIFRARQKIKESLKNFTQQ